LYDRYAVALFRTAYRLTGSAPDAEDVVHDVFVGLPEALRRYEERGCFEAWLTRITVRVALMCGRRAKRRCEAPLDEAAAIGGEWRGLDRSAEHAELRRAVMSLPTALRDVLILKQIEGYSHEEIGTLLGISAGASRVRLARALDGLRRMLR
jgi:RNA polymerase sigma-70 factor, ECF subfamily